MDLDERYLDQLAEAAVPEDGDCADPEVRKVRVAATRANLGAKRLKLALSTGKLKKVKKGL